MDIMWVGMKSGALYDVVSPSSKSLTRAVFLVSVFVS